MRVLFVADEFPWPADNGYRIRVADVIRGLAAAGSVDAFLASDVPEGPARTVPPDAPVDLVRAVDRPPIRRDVPNMARWLVGRRPRDVAWRDWSPVVTELEAFADKAYDLVWFSHAHTYLALGDVVAAPAIVDLDNLESQSLAHRIGSGAVPGELVGHLARVDSRRWAAVERRVAATTTVVTVCSELDAERLGAGSTVVVPNGYSPVPAGTRGDRPRPLCDGPPTVLLVGLHSYPPNADGARWLAREIWPRVASIVDGARLRIVGRGGEALGDLGSGIDITGAVARVEPELQQAHVAAIPIRFGGGTRIKVLEAFSHRIPVVSTTVGAEGILAVDGEHLLIADDAATFADACTRLLTDEAERTRLADAAHDLWRAHYRWEPIEDRIADLARRTAR